MAIPVSRYKVFNKTPHSVSFLTTSGTNPASGVSGVGALSGPWYVEEQRLNIQYKRVPKWDLTHGSVNLSATNLANQYIMTCLATQCWPRVTKAKVAGDYSTSTYFQPQRFTLYAVSADYTGQTYDDAGQVPAAGTLMVGGWIYTTQPYYFRRPWTPQDDIDSQSWTNPNEKSDRRVWEEHPQDGCPGFADGIMFGTSFRPFNAQECFIDSIIDPTEAGGWGRAAHNFTNHTISELTFWDTVAGANALDTNVQTRTGDDQAFVPFCGPLTGSLGFRENHGSIDSHMLGAKNGTYSYEHDTTSDVPVFIDNVSDIIAKPLAGSTNPADYFLGQSGGFVGVCQGLHAINNVHYDKTRHYWGG